MLRSARLDDAAEVSPSQIERLWRDAARTTAYVVMWFMSVRGAVMGGVHDLAVAIFVWSTLALVGIARAPTIPRARVIRGPLPNPRGGAV
jgi:hypothetical protein